VTSDQVITQRGTKATQTPERKTIFQVFHVLLDQSHPNRALTNDFVCKMTNSGAVTNKTKFKNMMLEDRMDNISECSTARLLNGVLYIWSGGMVTDNMTNLSNAMESTMLRGVTAMEEAMSSILVNDEPTDVSDIDVGKAINTYRE
jgi:hypothetical protein